MAEGGKIFHFPFVICHLSFVICYLLLFVICYLLFVILKNFETEGSRVCEHGKIPNTK